LENFHSHELYIGNLSGKFSHAAVAMLHPVTGYNPGWRQMYLSLIQGNDFRSRKCGIRTAITFYRDPDIGYPAVAASRGKVTMPDASFCTGLSGESGL
jgi:hypothetical protein